MRTQQAGFTLVELVMVIVILGILAATAVPKFVNLTQDANQAATNGFAGALASGSAINYASRTANSSRGIAVPNCQSLASTTVAGVLESPLPTGYSIGDVAITAGATATCTLTGLGGTTANFVGHGIS